MKLRAFEHAKHRTYVDLKVRWRWMCEMMKRRRCCKVACGCRAVGLMDEDVVVGVTK